MRRLVLAPFMLYSCLVAAPSPRSTAWRSYVSENSPTVEWVEPIGAKPLVLRVRPQVALGQRLVSVAREGKEMGSWLECSCSQVVYQGQAVDSLVFYWKDLDAHLSKQDDADTIRALAESSASGNWHKYASLLLDTCDKAELYHDSLSLYLPLRGKKAVFVSGTIQQAGQIDLRYEGATASLKADFEPTPNGQARTVGAR